MLIFSHTCGIQRLIKTYFCEIYEILWDLIGIKLTKFLIPLFLSRTNWRSTEPIDRTSSRSTGTVDRCARDVHKGQPIQSVDRAVDWLKAPLSGGGRSTGLSTVGLTVRKVTIGRSTRRSTGRAILPFPDCQRADFLEGINTHLLGWFLQVFQEKKLPSS